MKWTRIIDDVDLSEMEEVWTLHHKDFAYRYLYIHCLEGVLYYYLNTKDGVRELSPAAYQAYLDDPELLLMEELL